ncbi:uncharacterized protein JCM15063_002891 [Sporobolomyces koalae]|uniref:uncharacterized protein n=1 Tax=Sporobolomyces koalae TaxID=500713 RepID=UPI00318022EF
MGPPLAHPSLPAKPTTATTRLPPSYSAAGQGTIASTSTPLSLPNRPTAGPPAVPPNLVSRPTLHSAPSASILGVAASPKSAPASSTTPTSKDSATAPGELPWPRVRPRFTPQEATVNSELIELGQGWSIKYKCWRGPAIPLSNTSANLADYDPFLPPVASTSKLPAVSASTPVPSYSSTFPANAASPKAKDKDEAPPKKKPRALNAFDQLLADEIGSLSSPLGGPGSLPSTPLSKYQPNMRTYASTSKLDEQLAHLRACDADFEDDSFERARRDLIRRGKERMAEGGDPLDLLTYVRVAGTQLNVPPAEEVKGKGKEKEVLPDSEKVDGAGRALWAFSVVRGGEHEADKSPLDELSYDGLELIADGTIEHEVLYPALYPPSSTSAAHSNLAGTSPLARSAQNYPSALSLSSKFLPTPPNRSNTFAQAHQCFCAAIEQTLVNGIIATSHASLAPGSRTWQCLGRSLVHLPPFSASTMYAEYLHSSPISPRKRTLPLATRSTFKTTLQRSTIFVQTALEEVHYQPFPRMAAVPPGCPLLLAPVGLPATFVSKISLDNERQNRVVQDAVQKWTSQLEGSPVNIDGSEWIVCRLDQTTADSDSPKAEGGKYDFVWPVELIVVDGTRPLPSPSPQSSPEKSTPVELSSADGVSERIPSPRLGRASEPCDQVTPDAIPPPTRSQLAQIPPSPYDCSMRRRLASRVRTRMQRIRQTTDASETTDVETRRDPLTRRTHEIWSWMEDEALRKKREEADKLAQQRKQEEEAEERRRVEEAEKDKKKRGPPPVAAPINMRTPMSLGTSSTEAPSPAELAYPHPGNPNATNPSSTPYFPPSSAVGAAASRGEHPSLEIDGLGLGLYPSPEEGPQILPLAVDAAISTAVQPSKPALSSLDSAFASFDWGDGSYGTSVPGAGNIAVAARSQDYDDGMDLLGLTDDDFSFFDTAPTPLPETSIGQSSEIGLALIEDPFAITHSLSTSPKFGDHFSHLSAVPFNVTATSPISPYPAHTPPHFALHSSPSGPTPTVGPAGGPNLIPSLTTPLASLPEDNSMAMVPKSPQLNASPGRRLASLAVPSFSVALIDSSPRTSQRPRIPENYEALAFTPVYALDDSKYDPRKGKFGLPSPDYDDKSALLEQVLAQTSPDRIAGEKSLEPFYTGVCDPRRTLAARLLKNRRLKQKRSLSDSRGLALAPMRSRGWRRASSEKDDLSEGTITADEDSGEGSDMDVDETEQDELKKPRDGPDRSASEGLQRLAELGGKELMRLGEFASSLVHPVAAKTLPISPSSAALQAQELLLLVLVDQWLYNPGSRSMLSPGSAEPLPKILSTFSIKSLSNALHLMCSGLSPSPLFADHTILPALEASTSPSLVLRSQQAMVQVSTAALDFWKPMGFEPILGKKDVTVFAIYEEASATMHELIADWLKAADAVYHGLRLGKQSLGVIPASGLFGGTQDGHLALPAGSLSRGFSKEDSKVLSTIVTEIAKLYSNAVLFIFSPEGDEALSTSSPLFTLLHLLQRRKSPLSTTVSCPVRLSQLFAKQATSPDRLADYAFCIYDQLQSPVVRLNFPVPETFPSAAAASNAASQTPSVRLFQSPAIRLAPVRRRKISFDLNFPVSTLAVQQRHRFLHVCYTLKATHPNDNAEWIHLASIDDTGESWKSVNKVIKTPPGVPGDVMRARLVWSVILQLLVHVDVEWRIVICRLDEPSLVEIRAWDSMLKDQLAGIRRPLHVSFVYVDLAPPLSIVPSTAKPRRPSVQSETISEEGDLSLVSAGPRPSSSKPDQLFDQEPTVLAFTPAEPVSILPNATLFAPASTYLIHVPRIPTFTHSSVESSLSAPVARNTISILGIHFLLSNASRSSSYSASLSSLVKDVRQSYTELAALGRVRWGMNGRLPWHLEAVQLAREHGEAIGRRHRDVPLSSSAPPPAAPAA